MRGYFGIGVESISKAGNVGNLVRSAHAFGASFFFTVNAALSEAELNATDTSHAGGHLPFYKYRDVAGMRLPEDCQLVGIELMSEAVDLPSFRHPQQAAYVLGPELGSLSPEMVARCAHIVKIPTKFCVNVGIAGAMVMYDRLITLGRHAPRPIMPGGIADEDLKRGRGR
ncbi:MAG: TrmH family RNA methyltransferase [Alphaproteobacteria bacterium]|nr:TrmH family RNA methyltransferase [Alphaproteobacteria bacterium]